MGKAHQNYRRGALSLRNLSCSKLYFLLLLLPPSDGSHVQEPSLSTLTCSSSSWDQPVRSIVVVWIVQCFPWHSPYLSLIYPVASSPCFYLSRPTNWTASCPWSEQRCMPSACNLHPPATKQRPRPSVHAYVRELHVHLVHLCVYQALVDLQSSILYSLYIIYSSNHKVALRDSSCPGSIECMYQASCSSRCTAKHTCMHLTQSPSASLQSIPRTDRDHIICWINF
jgi:hypothetical protein